MLPRPWTRFLLSPDTPRVVDSYSPHGLKAKTFHVPSEEGVRDVHGYEFLGFWLIPASSCNCPGAKGHWTVADGQTGRPLHHVAKLPYAVGVAGWLATPRTVGGDS